MTDLAPISSRAAYTAVASTKQTAAVPLSAPPGPSGFFGELLDVVNPLQHLPGVSTVYQKASGDTMSAGASILGGGLFGGIIGAGVALVAEAFKAATGEDLATTAMNGAEALLAPDTKPAATPLVPDDGTAAREVAVIGTANAPAVTTAGPEKPVSNLEPYKTHSLNLDKPGMSEQTHAGLDEIALRMGAAS